MPMSLSLLEYLLLTTIGLPLCASGILAMLKNTFHRHFISFLSVVCMFLSCVGMVSIFVEVWLKNQTLRFSYTWIHIENIDFSIPLYIDKPAALLLLTVAFISMLVHLFSIYYMQADALYKRYLSFLGLFTGVMYGVIMSSSLLVMYFFWELVGLSSYLLIGFWREKNIASQAALKAFLLNKIGDIGFLIGILILWTTYYTLDFTDLEVIFRTPQENIFWINVAAIGFVMAAMSKSAQFPLSVWLPDAMAGPTPASALIHAATMVAAGIYLLFRIHPIFSENIFLFMVVIGCFTSILGAWYATQHHDIKKIVAGSTISQLGFMMTSVGIGAADVAFFHLITHAFFKACLFLCVGIIIHQQEKVFSAFHLHTINPQNLAFMGGFSSKFPLTQLSMGVALSSLVGLPFTSGFLSKGMILSCAWGWAEAQGKIESWLVPISLLIAALLSVWYAMRMFILIFRGKNRLPNSLAFSKIHEESSLALLPTGILAILALSMPFGLFSFTGEKSWIMQAIGSQNIGAKWEFFSEAIVLFFTFLVGYWIYLRSLLGYCASKKEYLFEKQSLFLHKIGVEPILRFSTFLGYLDTQIDSFFIILSKIVVVKAHALAWIDRYIVDGLVMGITNALDFSGAKIRNLQNRNLQHYLIQTLFWIFIILLGCFLFFLN